MKKLLYVLTALCTLLFTAVSCSEDNQLDTNQYKGGVSLNAFGPSPVARGGQIRFVGSGLNQITSVVFPGNVVVNDINVISENSIMVTVPKDGPEVGRIELKYAGGSLFTESDITYTEPISIDKLTPAKVKAGDLLTIEGDYLNLMNAVVFAVGDTIFENQFQEHSRYKIALFVPETAQTGRVAVSDGEQVVESEENLIVTLPAVAEIANLTGKKPGDAITLKGTDFDLVRRLTVAETETKFTINSDGGQVRFSQGNLQATTTNLGDKWTWGFAANQWDYIGDAAANTKINGNGTVSENGTVDLFGWVGASSSWTGDAQYGISNSTTDSEYGTSSSDALKSDWGNTISSGWRTLTIAEWAYLFNTRSGSTVNGTSNARYAYATINDGTSSVEGMILFPDGVTIADSEVTWGTINGTGTRCTSKQWTALEGKGCVFLPAAGYRINATVLGAYGPGTSGNIFYYWSSSPYSSGEACDVYFDKSLSLQSFNYRSKGLSVRLVRDVK